LLSAQPPAHRCHGNFPAGNTPAASRQRARIFPLNAFAVSLLHAPPALFRQSRDAACAVLIRRQPVRRRRLVTPATPLTLRHMPPDYAIRLSLRTWLSSLMRRFTSIFLFRRPTAFRRRQLSAELSADFLLMR